MNRTKAILAAGTLTGLILATLLVLGSGRPAAADSAAVTDTAVTDTVVTDTAAVVTAVDPAAAAAQDAYVQELEQAVLTLQSREQAYQAQIEQANATIAQLQDALNAAQTNQLFAPAGRHAERGFWGGDDD